MDLRGRGALVTGGSGDLGTAISVALARAGCDVAVGYVGNRDGALRTAKLVAEHLLLTMQQTPLRAADALHLALAISARAASLASFDARLAAAGRAAGLAVYPPSPGGV